MRPGLTEDLQVVDDTRETTVIDRELHRLHVDFVALQEKRLPESRSLKEVHYTFFWQGKGAAETRQHGVAFAVRNTLFRMIEPPTDGTERLLTLRLSTADGLVNLVYTELLSTLSSPECFERGCYSAESKWADLNVIFNFKFRRGK